MDSTRPSLKEHMSQANERKRGESFIGNKNRTLTDVHRIVIHGRILRNKTYNSQSINCFSFVDDVRIAIPADVSEVYKNGKHWSFA